MTSINLGPGAQVVFFSVDAEKYLPSEIIYGPQGRLNPKEIHRLICLQVQTEALLWRNAEVVHPGQQWRICIIEQGSPVSETPEPEKKLSALEKAFLKLMRKIL